MVKNLYAAEKGKGLSRKGLLLLLDRCGLGDRYSFFYMPCNKVKGELGLPGFAFVNFLSPSDVYALHGALAGELWREVCGSSPAKPPALSYAHFQGHEAMVQHFSLSFAFQASDPETRPILQPEVLHKSNASLQEGLRAASRGESSPENKQRLVCWTEQSLEGVSVTGDAWTLRGAFSDADGSADSRAGSPRELAPGAADLSEPTPSSTDAAATPSARSLCDESHGTASAAATGNGPTAAPRTALRPQARAFVPVGAAAAGAQADPGPGKQRGQGVSQQVVTAKRSTVMMCNVPPSYTREDVVVLLDSYGFAKKVDFLYMPIDFTTMLGIGCAFLNMTTREHAKEFARVFDGFTDWGAADSRVCRVRWSAVQGLAKNMQRLQNSPVMSASVPNSCKPLLFEDGLRIPFPVPIQTSCTERNKARQVKKV
ncbi:unnamed protein product [Prorocentrum cordatum]|nr:unnamed protein product [Polarella glacialis]